MEVDKFYLACAHAHAYIRQVAPERRINAIRVSATVEDSVPVTVVTAEYRKGVKKFELLVNLNTMEVKEENE